MWPNPSKAQALKLSAHFLVIHFKLFYFPWSPSAYLSQLLWRMFVWANAITAESGLQERTGKFSPDFLKVNFTLTTVPEQQLHG